MIDILWTNTILLFVSGHTKSKAFLLTILGEKINIYEFHLVSGMRFSLLVFGLKALVLKSSLNNQFSLWRSLKSP